MTASLVLAGCADDSGAPEENSPSAEASAEASESAAAPGQAEPTEADIAAVEAIEVTGEVGDEPELAFDALEVSVPTTVVVDSGDGDELTEGMKVTMHYVAYDAAGERIGSTWEQDYPESFLLGDPTYELLTAPLVGQSVGTRFLIANPTYDAQNEPSTVVNLVEITEAVEIPARAEGEAVEPADGLPTVTLDDQGAPSVEIPDGYEGSDELVVQTLIQGEGEEMDAEQTITAHYTGWTLDGEVFDSSWERGDPFSRPLAQMIPGWIEGLAGQAVGSQVLLVVPAEQAYGAEADGSHELAGEDLIFVVDILDAG
nr:FKBP-type peptidyl-prolyl cis-trans isomerase [Isoptericola halotolerans]